MQFNVRLDRVQMLGTVAHIYTVKHTTDHTSYMAQHTRRLTNTPTRTTVHHIMLTMLNDTLTDVEHGRRSHRLARDCCGRGRGSAMRAAGKEATSPSEARRFSRQRLAPEPSRHIANFQP